MVLDVVVANTYVTDNNDQFTPECLQDIADNINKENLFRLSYRTRFGENAEP